MSDSRDLLVAWAAGFLDGDGSFVTTSRGVVVLSAAQTGDRRPLDRLAELFGGKVTPLRRISPTGKTVFHWRIQTRSKIVKATQELLPHLLVKREAALLLLESARLADERGRPRLSEANVEAIRASSEHPRVLAERFGVCRSTVYRVRAR